MAEFCDGWIPLSFDVEGTLKGISELKETAARAGRDWKTISVTTYSTRPDASVLERYREAGVARVVLRLPSEPRDRVLPLLDKYAALQ